MYPWTMFLNGVSTSSKETVAPPKKAMIADSLELLPPQMVHSFDSTVFKFLDHRGGTDMEHTSGIANATGVHRHVDDLLLDFRRLTG